MSIRDCEILFDTTADGRMDTGWQSGVLRQRAKTVKAGKMLYCESYPIWDTATKREAGKLLEEMRKKKGTTEAQKRLNARNAQKKLSWLTNENFGEGDLLLACTYPDGSQPEDADAAQTDARNMIRRIRGLRCRKALEELKYIYVTEVTESKEHGTRYHHHMIINGDGLTREEVEELWLKKHGGICNSRRCQWQITGLTGFAHYITKQTGENPKGQEVATKRRWCCSKNLKTPKQSVADKKISRRRVEAIAQDVEGNGKAIFEKLYPGYIFVEATVKFSKFVSGAYMYITMCKRDERRKQDEKHGIRKRPNGHDGAGVRGAIPEEKVHRADRGSDR